MRKIPVGYCSSDLTGETVSALRDYLGCGGDNSTTVDFFGLNRYSWCGQSSFTVSGYADLYNQSLDFPLPVFFSETGCNFVGNRTFDDQVAILGPAMNQKWSGAIMYLKLEKPSLLFAEAETFIDTSGAKKRTDLVLSHTLSLPAGGVRQFLELRAPQRL